jgi:hypothetical protein
MFCGEDRLFAAVKSEFIAHRQKLVAEINFDLNSI